MTLPPVVSDPEVCPERAKGNDWWNQLPHVWGRGENRLGWLLSWLGLTDRYPLTVCRFCGGRKP